MMWRTPVTQAFADAVDGRRPAKGEVAELVAVATRLCEIAAETEPSPEFRSALRTRLMAAPAPVTMVARSAGSARRSAVVGRWTAAFAAMVATTFGAGLTSASASTIPGDTLYPVKRVLENTQLAFKYTDSTRGGYHLRMATERLTEVDELTTVRGTATQLTSETLAEFRRQAGLGSDALLRAYLSNDSTADLVTLNRFSASSAHLLADLRGRLSAGDFEQAEGVLGDLTAQSVRMCPDCEGSIAASELSPPSTTETATETPAPSESSTAISSRSSTTTDPPASAEPNAVTSSSVTSTPTPELPASTPVGSPAPPMAELVEKSVVKPLRPLTHSGSVKDLRNHGEQLLNLHPQVSAE